LLLDKFFRQYTPEACGGILFQNLLFLKENTFRGLIFAHFNTLGTGSVRANVAYRNTGAIISHTAVFF
jgi:hypothetical protein